ncbi:MAG: sigma-70 family RNA polymerase sigma factor [Anaerolineales bacterium]|nr:MAG: sigma-70 family RNA polymerase sigma factor [Anaerolineales bacterium]
MQAYSDRGLVQMAIHGEQQAFGELVRRYQTSVFNVCYHIMGERQEAEDMTQETFLRAHDRLRTYDPYRPFGPWIRRVGANLCLNGIKRRRLATLPLEEELEGITGRVSERPEPAQVHAERSQAIRAAILSLPGHYRAVIELRHFFEMSYQEIAETLELPLSDVKSHLFRARKILAERLSPDV